MACCSCTEWWPAGAGRGRRRRQQLGEVVVEVAGSSHSGKATTISSSSPSRYHTSAAANSSRRPRSQAITGRRQGAGAPPCMQWRRTSLWQALETSVAQGRGCQRAADPEFASATEGRGLLACASAPQGADRRRYGSPPPASRAPPSPWTPKGRILSICSAEIQG
jgi:hypothetical protein